MIRASKCHFTRSEKFVGFIAVHGLDISHRLLALVHGNLERSLSIGMQSGL
jgi:hypothetical protein